MREALLLPLCENCLYFDICADREDKKCEYFCPIDCEAETPEELNARRKSEMMGDWFEYSMEYDGGEAYSSSDTFCY